jgi:hypothetical protein
VHEDREAVVTAAGWRRLAWVALPLATVVAYVALREYADRARSLEAVLGLAHGDPTWHAVVALLVVVSRVSAYALVGGTLVAWPLDEWLRRRAPTTTEGSAAPGTPPPT